MKQYLMPSYGEIMKHALTCKAIGAEVCSSVWCEFVLVKINMNQLGVILYLNMYVCKFEPIQHVFRQKAFCKESILFHSYTLFYSLQRGQGIFIAINYTHVFSCDPLNILRCREAVNFDIAQCSIGSLGGGNHFIELNEDEEGNKYLVIHSGSRNLGVRVCNYYQKIAEKNCQNSNVDRNKIIAELKSQGRESEIQSAINKAKSQSIPLDKDLAHLTGEDMQNYLHDMDICQRYAELNRETIADLILTEFSFATCYATETPFHTIHNYIEMPFGRQPMLRKGAVAAYRGQRLIIPMNMRDGSLLCVGKGNTDWNCSAPHGAGRLMSRKKAKEAISMAEFEKSMSDVYSTSVCESTIDEAPQAYKPMQAIIDAIHDTVDIVKIIKPIYNFKAKN